jgi:hypothetical protein
MGDLGLAEHLPPLRRYARILTGDRYGGDLLVAASCDVIVEDPDALDRRVAIRAAIHRVLATVYNTMTHAPGPAVPRALAGPATPLARQATLLVALEEFSAADAARILGVATGRLAELLDEDRAALAADAADVLILDSDRCVALDLGEALEAFGHRVLGRPATRSDAVALAHAHRPDIVVATGAVQSLADGGSPLEVVEEVRWICDASPLVVTALPGRLLRGNEREPPFVVAKPCRDETVVAIVAQIMWLRRRAEAGPAG